MNQVNLTIPVFTTDFFHLLQFNLVAAFLSEFRDLARFFVLTTEKFQNPNYTQLLKYLP